MAFKPRTKAQDGTCACRGGPERRSKDSMAAPEQIQAFVQLEINGSAPIAPAPRTSLVSEKVDLYRLLGVVVDMFSLRKHSEYLGGVQYNTAQTIGHTLTGTFPAVEKECLGLVARGS
jgi:hypothetical protein